ncbi:hypothetical protein QP163_24655, partial [Escherichia coli]|nr:hypothetical protein [Escherichia coli]
RDPIHHFNISHQLTSAFPGAPRLIANYTEYPRRTVFKPRAPFFAAASGVCADRRFRKSAFLSMF